MPIKNPEPPKFRASVIGPPLAKITMSNLTGPPGQIVGHLPSDVQYADPHRYYFVRLDSVLEGYLLDKAEAKNWRYLLISGGSGAGEVEVATSPDENNDEVVDRFVAIHQGESAQRTLDVLRVAESLPDVANTDFELRFLQVPALYFFAVWLHASTRDLLIPTTNAVRDLEMGRAYSESEVLNALKSRAAEAERFNRDQEFR